MTAEVLMDLLLLLVRVLMYPTNMQFIPQDTELLAHSTSNTLVLRKWLMLGNDGLLYFILLFCQRLG